MSQISPLMFFSSEKELFSGTYLLKKTQRRTKVLISPVWNRILKIWDTLFELLQIEVQCSKNYLKTVSPREAGAFRNNVEHKSHVQNWKNMYVIYLHKNLLCLQSNASGNFLQKCIYYFVEQRLKFSHFKGNIIP